MICDVSVPALRICGPNVTVGAPEGCWPPPVHHCCSNTLSWLPQLWPCTVQPLQRAPQLWGCWVCWWTCLQTHTLLSGWSVCLYKEMNQTSQFPFATKAHTCHTKQVFIQRDRQVVQGLTCKPAGPGACGAMLNLMSRLLLSYVVVKHGTCSHKMSTWLSQSC